MPTILITGANRGIGFEAAKQYAEKKWQVLACCRRPDEAKELTELQQKFSTYVSIYQLDVNSEQDIQKLVYEIKNQPIDIFWNGAATHAVWKKLGFFSSEQIEKTQIMERLRYDLNLDFQTNTIAPLMLSLWFLDNIMLSKQKLIVNVGGDMGSYEHHAKKREGNDVSYRISKSGLIMATQCLAYNLEEKNVTVVCVHPGWVKTQMGGDNAPMQPSECIEKMTKLIDSLSLNDSGIFFSYTGERLTNTYMKNDSNEEKSRSFYSRL